MTVLKEKVFHFILQHQLLDKDHKYLVALSGGADSVALTHILQELGYQLEACHCNFHLRGEESNRDESFCIDFCKQFNIPLHRVHFDTKEYATLHKVSIEMAARELRYRYFEQLRKDIHADGICVAHHEDDQAETVLINLIRGTGLKGLSGMAAKNGHIIRPLLCVSRKEIEDYLISISQPFVTDSTNLIDDVVRNQIRLNIIPLLRNMNPAICNNIAQTAEHLTEAGKMLDSYIHLLSENLPTPNNGIKAIPKDWILSQASAEYALFSQLSPCGFTGKMIATILQGIHSTGKTWESSTHVVLADRNELLIQAKNSMIPFTPFLIPETGIYRYQENQTLKLSVFSRPADFHPSKENHRITLDADKVAFPLTLRLTEAGDRFKPFGMEGTKLVSDFLTDRKKNLFEKQKQLVLVDANNHIIWVLNERTSDCCKITDATQNILTIES